MANAYEVIPSPGFWTGPEYTNPEILYSTVGFTQKGVTLAGGQGVLPAGTLLARNSVTKKYVKYANGGANGTGTPVGFLRTGADTGGAGARDQQGNVVIAGILKLNMLSGVDGAATTALGGTSNAAMGWYKF